MHSITWLSGFAFGAAVHGFLNHDPAMGLLALVDSILIAWASHILRPRRTGAGEEGQG